MQRTAPTSIPEATQSHIHGRKETRIGRITAGRHPVKAERVVNHLLNSAQAAAEGREKLRGGAGDTAEVI